MCASSSPLLRSGRPPDTDLPPPLASRGDWPGLAEPAGALPFLFQECLRIFCCDTLIERPPPVETEVHHVTGLEHAVVRIIEWCPPHDTPAPGVGPVVRGV